MYGSVFKCVHEVYKLKVYITDKAEQEVPDKLFKSKIQK